MARITTFLSTCRLGQTALLALIMLTGCQTVSIRQRDAGIPAREIDGLALGPGTSITTREVIALLGVGKECASHTVRCAEIILSAEGTVREGTRLIAASDVLYQSARRARQTETALSRCVINTHRYLFARNLAGRRGPLNSRTQLALRLHNACTAGLLDMWSDEPTQMTWEVDPNDFPIAAVRRLLRSQRVQTAGLRTRQFDDGIGVPAVAFGRTELQNGSFPTQPFALPVTVRAEPSPNAHGVRLLVSDASRPRLITTAYGPTEMARDVSGAYASAAIAFEEELSWWRGFRQPSHGETVPRIRLLAPVDREKTPVFLVHGLASSPMTWANLVNELQGDPDIALHYQFWLVRYFTGIPLLQNRQLLEKTISDFHRSAFNNQPPACNTGVVIGHSMGGVLARLLATDSGPALWNAAFEVSPSSLQGQPEDLEAVKNVFLFSRLEGIDELVLIAAPHRGSKLADSALSRMVRRVIRGPGETINFLARITSANPELVHPTLRGSYLRGGPGSLDTLTPTQPVTLASSQLPVSPDVRVHSIIGIEDPRKPEAGDGAVSLASASWPTGATHLVNSDHAVHAKPETASIIKQVLLDRIRRNNDIGQTENCPARHRNRASVPSTRPGH